MPDATCLPACLPSLLHLLWGDCAYAHQHSMAAAGEGAWEPLLCTQWLASGAGVLHAALYACMHAGAYYGINVLSYGRALRAALAGGHLQALNASGTLCQAMSKVGQLLRAAFALCPSHHQASGIGALLVLMLMPRNGRAAPTGS